MHFFLTIGVNFRKRIRPHDKVVIKTIVRCNVFSAITQKFVINYFNYESIKQPRDRSRKTAYIIHGSLIVHVDFTMDIIKFICVRERLLEVVVVIVIEDFRPVDVRET